MISFMGAGKGQSRRVFNNTVGKDVTSPVDTVSDGGREVKREFFDGDGELHNDYGLALIIQVDGCCRRREYFLHGKLHRKSDHPASIVYREDGSVFREHYSVDGQNHRVGGPTYVEYNENGSLKEESYRRNNARHREDGPALILYDDDGVVLVRKYYLNGKQVTLEDLPLVKSWLATPGTFEKVIF